MDSALLITRPNMAICKKASEKCLGVGQKESKMWGTNHHSELNLFPANKIDGRKAAGSSWNVVCDMVRQKTGGENRNARGFENNNNLQV